MRSKNINKADQPSCTLRRWSISAKHCYKRGCVCSGCLYKDFFTEQKCQMKASVLELVRVFGKPTDVITKILIED